MDMGVSLAAPVTLASPGSLFSQPALLSFAVSFGGWSSGEEGKNLPRQFPHPPSSPEIPRGLSF